MKLLFLSILSEYKFQAYIMCVVKKEKKEVQHKWDQKDIGFFHTYPIENV